MTDTIRERRKSHHPWTPIKWAEYAEDTGTLLGLVDEAMELLRLRDVYTGEGLTGGEKDFRKRVSEVVG